MAASKKGDTNESWEEWDFGKRVLSSVSRRTRLEQWSAVIYRHLRSDRATNAVLIGAG